MDRQFIRKVHVIIGDMEFKYPDFTIFFRVEYSDKEDEVNDAEVSIYNLATETKNKIKKGMTVIVNAGYEGDVGNVFIGKIDSVETDKLGLDRATTIIAVDSREEWAKQKINRAYKAGTRASLILRDIVTMSGFIPAVISLPKDVMYQRGRTVNSRLPDAARAIAKDCGAKVNIIKGKFYVRGPNEGDDIAFLFNADRGLIGSPERFEDDDGNGYNVKALLNHRIQTSSIINVDSSTARGRFRVRKAVFTANRNDFYVEMEVV